MKLKNYLNVIDEAISYQQFIYIQDINNYIKTFYNIELDKHCIQTRFSQSTQKHIELNILYYNYFIPETSIFCLPYSRKLCIKNNDQFTI